MRVFQSTVPKWGSMYSNGFSRTRVGPLYTIIYCWVSSRSRTSSVWVYVLVADHTVTGKCHRRIMCLYAYTAFGPIIVSFTGVLILKNVHYPYSVSNRSLVTVLKSNSCPPPCACWSLIRNLLFMSIAYYFRTSAH